MPEWMQKPIPRIVASVMAPLRIGEVSALPSQLPETLVSSRGIRAHFPQKNATSKLWREHPFRRPRQSRVRGSTWDIGKRREKTTSERKIERGVYRISGPGSSAPGRGDSYRELPCGGTFLHGQPAAFGVDAVALPLLGEELSQHPPIRFPKQAEHFERFAGIPWRIIPNARPQVLIEAEELRAFVFEHLAITPRAGQFVLRQMRQDLSYRPLARCGTDTDPGFGNTLD
jgi:hypothetical protein